MDLTTYAGLQAAVADYVARDDLVPRIPSFIALAEAKFARQLRTIEMERTVVLTTAADGSASLPADFVEVRSVNTVGQTGQDLDFLPADIAAIRNSRGGGTTAYGYAIAGSVFTAVPAGVIAATLIYTAEFVPLSMTAPSNWLLANHPDAYIYGTLAEYGVFNQSDDPAQVQAWIGQTAAIIDDVQTADRRRRFGQGRMMPPRCAP